MTGGAKCFGMAIGHSEAEVFWTDFLRSLARRGLRGVKLVISDSHEGIKASVAKVFCPTWQRCRVGPLKKAEVGQAVAVRLRFVGPGSSTFRITAARRQSNAARNAASRFRLIAAAAR